MQDQPSSEYNQTVFRFTSDEQSNDIDFNKLLIAHDLSENLNMLINIDTKNSQQNDHQDNELTQSTFSLLHEFATAYGVEQDDLDRRTTLATNVHEWLINGFNPLQELDAEKFPLLFVDISNNKSSISPEQIEAFLNANELNSADYSTSSIKSYDALRNLDDDPLQYQDPLDFLDVEDIIHQTKVQKVAKKISRIFSKSKSS